MNKKIFLLLPIAALLLGGCKQETSNKVIGPDDDDDEEVIPPFDAAIYGTETSPLTVAQLSSACEANIAKEDQKFSYYPFYVQAYVDAATMWDSSYDQWATFYLKDSLSGSGNGFQVQRCVSPDLSLGTNLCKGDRVLVTGYTEYYQGRYSFFPKGSVKPEIVAATRGTSSFTIQNLSSGSVTIQETFNTSYTNMSSLTMHATCNLANYGVIVKVNDAILNPNNDGSYTIVIKGDTVVKVSAEYNGPRADLPNGNYTIRFDHSNCQLGTTTTSNNNLVELDAIEDNPGASEYWKKVQFDCNGKVYKHPTEAYREVSFASGGKIVVTVPNGKITNIKVCFYQNKSLDVYKGNSTAASAKVSFSEDSAHVKTPVEGFGDQSYLKIWDVPAADQGKVNTIVANSGACNIYYIEVLFTVA